MRLFLALLVFVLALAAGFGFQREYAVALTVRDTPLRVMEKFGNAAPPVPFSWRGTRNLMLSCHDTQTGFAIRLQPPEAQNAINAHCADTARGILKRTPTASIAHLVVAVSAIHHADTAEFNAALIRAAATAPREGWMVARRHTAANLHFDALDAAGRDVWAADTRVLLEERWGREIVAVTYVSFEARRPEIEQIVETMPNAAQRDFVARVRELTRMQQAF